MRPFYIFLIVALAISNCDGQLFRRPTPRKPEKPEKRRPAPPVVKPKEDVGPLDYAAVRVRAGTSCGSGSVCGVNLVLTNAHVVSTTVGRSVTVDAVIDGEDVTVPGRVIMAAYSSQTATDWAIVACEGLEAIEPVRLSIDPPRGPHYTRGSPGCVWPLTGYDIDTVDDLSKMWTWEPTPMRGRSGSALYSRTTSRQEGLLTWALGDLGAGQRTSDIYRQATDQTVAGPPRVRGLEPVDDKCDCLLDGFFAEVGIRDLDIWASDADEANPDNDKEPPPVVSPDLPSTAEEPPAVKPKAPPAIAELLLWMMVTFAIGQVLFLFICWGLYVQYVR